MSKILITGGAGFIGSNFVRYMLERGHSVLNIDKLTYAGNLSSLADIAENRHYRFSRVDITDSTSIADAFASFSPDAVVHLAAESHVDRSIDGPGTFVQTNVTGTYVLLQCALTFQQTLSPARARSFRFLHVSTDEVFGSLGDNGYFTEHTPYSPRSPYSATKAASDHLVRAWHCTYKLPVLITNCSNNYGPFQFPEKLFPVVILKCLRREPIPVYGRGENVRDWLYVLDHCAALELVLEKGRPGATYNIGGSNEIKNIDLVHHICSLMDELRPRDDGKSYSRLIEFVDDRPGHDIRYAMDSTKIRRELGWQPTHDPECALKATVHWYLENESWWTSILDSRYALERLGRVRTEPSKVTSE